MLATLEKVKRLEQYLSLSKATVDPVLDQSVDKILAREEGRLLESKSRLLAQIAQFESQYTMSSDIFVSQYQNGDLGDNIDFIEWAATLEMLANIDSHLALLTTSE